MGSEIFLCFCCESRCLEYLDLHAVFYTAMDCPDCGEEMKRYLSRMSFRCPVHRCRKEISLQYGTLFYKSALPTNRILLIMWEWLHKTPATALTIKYIF